MNNMVSCLIKREYAPKRDRDGFKVWTGKWILFYEEQNVEILFDSWEELHLYLKKNLIKNFKLND